MLVKNKQVPLKYPNLHSGFLSIELWDDVEYVFVVRKEKRISEIFNGTVLSSSSSY